MHAHFRRSQPHEHLPAKAGGARFLLWLTPVEGPPRHGPVPLTGHFGVILGVILGSFWGPFWGHFGVILGVILGSFWVILGPK